jgi:iron complex outermembrane recepter protein
MLARPVSPTWLHFNTNKPCAFTALAMLWGLLVLSCPAPAFAQSQIPPVPRYCSGVIDIHVVDALEHEPVVNAQVSINQRLVGSTDELGRLELPGLCQGQLMIEVFHEAFDSASRTLAFDKSASVEVALKSSAEVYTIETKVVHSIDTRSTATVSGEALERKRGQTLSETLSDVPGVSQLRSGSGVAKPIVRGQFGRRLPMIVDGVRHRSQDWGMDHAPEIDPSMADRITVIRGASGVRYGPDAIGGAVLVDSPELRRTPGVAGETHLIGFSNPLGGNLMGRVQAVSASIPALTLQLDGSLKRLRAAETPDYALNNTGASQWTAGLTAAYRANAATYQLSFRHLQEELGICSCYKIESAADFFAQINQRRPQGSELYVADFAIDRPYQSVAHELALARARWSIGSLGTVTGSYAFQYDVRGEYDVVRQATSGPQFLFRLWTHDVDLTFEHKPLHLSEHQHLIGSVGVVGMMQVHSYQGLALVPDHQAASAGVFAMERLVADDFEIEGGVRYDVLDRTASLARNDFLRLVRSGQLTDSSCDASKSGTESIECASTFHTPSASLGAVRRFGKAWSGKLDLSIASRPPSPDEQYINGTAPSYPVFGLGRPTIGAETTYSSSVTAAYNTDQLKGEASLFGNFVSDYIYFAPAIGADGKPVFDVLIRGSFPRFVTRPVDAVFYGADGGLAWSMAPWIELSAQASMVRARNVSDNSYLAFVPADNARGSITLNRKSFFGLQNAKATIAGSYTTRQSRYDLASDLAPPPEDYFLFGGMLAAETRVANQTFKFALMGFNILGQRYREYASLLRYFSDQPGRQVSLRVSLAF